MDKDGVIVAIGYSGNGDHKNDPLSDHIKGKGPIPRGMWKMVGVYDSQKVGKFAITLEPYPNTKTHGRSEFRIHGDSIKDPGTASDGCIVIPIIARRMIWESGDRALKVTS